jgi:hypothetical protein
VRRCVRHARLRSLAGHLIECGAQATGGIFTDWAQVPDMARIGFPIAEFDASRQDEFTITKPKGKGRWCLCAMCGFD